MQTSRATSTMRSRDSPRSRAAAFRDRRVLKLIDQWLRAGVLIDGQRHQTRRGVPQGGVTKGSLNNK